MSTKEDMKGVLIVLMHELGVALEMSYSPDEMRELWGEALDGLARGRQILIQEGVAIPPVVDNVLKHTASGPQ